MNSSQIEANLQELVKSFNTDSFIYDLLLAYGQPKASITRLHKGGLNLSKNKGEIAWKKKVFFKSVSKEDLHVLIEDLKADDKAIKHDPRFIIVTDFKTLLAVDRKTTYTLDIPILEIPRYYDFFLPWAGMEKSKHKSENPADVKAAYQMAKLYDEIKKDNPINTTAESHNLNVFLSRLLFCFFAEDTGIFPKGLFTRSIESHTQQDGSDLNTYLDKLFSVMDTEKSKRKNLAAHFDAFPYVNGGLYQHKLHAPVFTRQSRKDIIKCGELNWSDINPDIFGSIMQGVVLPEQRGGMGMHYTSIPNIMKVIKPLFLDDLYEEFEAAKNEPRRLNKLHDRIAKLKIFDPACGSGNFLIISYKELRILEIKILQRLQELKKSTSGFEPKQMELIPKSQQTLAASFQFSLFSRIQVSQFYGIELDDFAHEIAILSLWLAEHQMNLKFNETFKVTNSSLPLKPGGNIIQGNATRLDWDKICEKCENDEIFVLGNPPYKGSSGQTKTQKEDMTYVFKGVENYKSLDYISIWFIKGSNYIQDTNSRFAFVSTNSICQGEQVALLWPIIFNKGIEINFAYTSFKWKNNAKDNAGVSVIIVGLKSNLAKSNKYLFIGTRKIKVDNINAYLTHGHNLIVEKRQRPLSLLPEMVSGNKPVYGEPLILNRPQRDELISAFPNSRKYIKRYLGNREFIDNVERFVLWISDSQVSVANKIKPISDRIKEVKELRLSSSDVGARQLALRAHQFRDFKETKTVSILIPQTGSEKRKYIPIGFSESDTIISNAFRVLFDSEVWLFSLLSSLMHITWVKAVSGRLKTDMQYSNTICYNTFPFPPINQYQKQILERHVYEVLQERERHSEKTLAQLYDPDKMPDGLKAAHYNLDLAVERCYRSKPFENDEERLNYLFLLYEQMIIEERERNGELIFERPKSKTKKRKRKR